VFMSVLSFLAICCCCPSAGEKRACGALACAGTVGLPAEATMYRRASRWHGVRGSVCQRSRSRGAAHPACHRDGCRLCLLTERAVPSLWGAKTRIDAVERRGHGLSLLA